MTEQRSSTVNAGHTEAEGYSSSLRQQAEWIEESRDGTVPVHMRIDLGDIDVDELRAAADFIEREARAPAQPSAGAPRLWQERAPNGGWFVETEHDGHVFFGADKDSAEQCLRALSRVSAQRQPGWVDQNHQIDRYGVALMMIREGCADPAGLARRILGEFGSALPSTDGSAP